MLLTLGVPDESFFAYWGRLSSRTVEPLKVFFIFLFLIYVLWLSGHKYRLGNARVHLSINARNVCLFHK